MRRLQWCWFLTTIIRRRRTLPADMCDGRDERYQSNEEARAAHP